MDNDINYLDLVILKKLEPDSTVEKFGPTINTSFFETANILGTMKIKGLIDIQSSIGGLSPIIVLPQAKELISLAIKKASEPLDNLDFEILALLKKGVRELSLLERTLNITSLDLALRLYKLKSNGYISDQVQSARVYLSLTEKGFLLSKEKGGEVGSQTTLFSQEVVKESKEQKSEAKYDEIDSEIKDLIIDKTFLSPQKKQSEQPHTAAAENVQKQKRKLPWEVEEKPVKLDKTTMLLSKLEYYIRNYGVYILLSSILIFLLLIALILIFVK